MVCSKQGALLSRPTSSRMAGHEQQVAVEAEQHGQAGVELAQGGALHEGLQGGGDGGQAEPLHLLLSTRVCILALLLQVPLHQLVDGEPVFGRLLRVSFHHIVEAA